MTEKPWVKGPLELLEHGAEHLRVGREKDLRFAIIHVDNALEVAFKVYVEYEKRLVPGIIKKKDWVEIKQSFRRLLDIISKKTDFISDELYSAIIYYHDLRNEVYHRGDGITVRKEDVDNYLQIASNLFNKMFGVSVPHRQKIKPEKVSRDLESSAKFYGSILGKEWFLKSKQILLSPAIYRMFEEFVVKLLKKQGYTVKRNSRIGNFSVDVLAYKNSEAIVIEIIRVDSRMMARQKIFNIGFMFKSLEKNLKDKFSNVVFRIINFGQEKIPSQLIDEIRSVIDGVVEIVGKEELRELVNRCGDPQLLNEFNLLQEVLEGNGFLVTLAGKRLIITRSMILKASKDPKINKFHSRKYFVEIKGKRYPAKGLLSIATGIPPSKFISTEAIRILERLGFRVIKEHY
ncbi:MAG: hypothetical protein DRP00_05265 [Candidatus Aenigmatarchaeota archaeon]|nr:MAG: hypothetical protein DRP00_05265 [Candidatus Aenigmarchaeota archaeon]